MRLRLVAGLVAAVVGIGPAAAVAATPRASLTDVENDVMCVTCHEPLVEAQSPQATEERDYIRGLIVQGYDKQQIERSLVAQYGPAVLGKPPASGFDLTVYLLPAGVVVLALATTAIVLPRWRRTTRAAQGPLPLAAGPGLSAAEARRLDEELSHFD
ncbi:MAG: cytochrome c-type biosis protein CcmH [Solirubrobacteraceae bacterium]|jgi:cytochrome c-type biogenesis protein CcmH/NrfF|nr:cytochrome c-type biosis protein CcmH [Solirubrobacteraceae bacterium]